MVVPETGAIGRLNRVRENDLILVGRTENSKRLCEMLAPAPIPDIVPPKKQATQHSGKEDPTHETGKMMQWSQEEVVAQIPEPIVEKSRGTTMLGPGGEFALGYVRKFVKDSREGDRFEVLFSGDCVAKMFPTDAGFAGSNNNDCCAGGASSIGNIDSISSSSGNNKNNGNGSNKSTALTGTAKEEEKKNGGSTPTAGVPDDRLLRILAANSLHLPADLAAGKPRAVRLPRIRLHRHRAASPLQSFPDRGLPHRGAAPQTRHCAYPGPAGHRQNAHARRHN